MAAIVALVQREHYAGIDIDYEDLRASDKNAFTAFITQLADALHAKGKVLSVDLFAKTTTRATPSATSRRTTTPSARWPTRCG